MGKVLGRLVMVGAAALLAAGCVYEQSDSISSAALYGNWVGDAEQPADGYRFLAGDELEAGDRFELYRYDFEGNRELVRTGSYRIEERPLLVPRGETAILLITEIDWDSGDLEPGTQVEQTITDWHGDRFELGGLLIDTLPRTYEAVDELP